MRTTSYVSRWDWKLIDDWYLRYDVTYEVMKLGWLDWRLDACVSNFLVFYYSSMLLCTFTTLKSSLIVPFCLPYYGIGLIDHIHTLKVLLSMFSSSNTWNDKKHQNFSYDDMKCKSNKRSLKNNLIMWWLFISHVCKTQENIILENAIIKLQRKMR